MAWPADYHLPALSIIDDSPPGSDFERFQIVSEQLEGVRLILNERRRLSGLAEVSEFTEPIKRSGYGTTPSSTINALRASCESVLAYHLNHNVHAGGSIQGVERPHNATACTGLGYTVWTRATILNYLGLGVGGDWTRIPSRNAFGRTASGGALQPGDPCFKEHINELLQVLNGLQYLVVTAGGGSNAIRLGDGLTSESCDAAKAAAETSYNAASWTALADGFGPGVLTWNRFTYISGPTKYYQAHISGTRGKLTKNLSAIPATSTGKCYLTLMGTYAPYYSFGGNTPHGAGEYTWGEWVDAGLSFGGTWTSPYFATTPAWNGTCALEYPSYTGLGWSVANRYQAGAGWMNDNAAVLVIEPDFEYQLP